MTVNLIDTEKHTAPLGNPATGEVVITLTDGKPRSVLFDIESLYLLEEVHGPDLLQILRHRFSVINLSTLIYAGAFRQAMAAREPWSPQIVRGLLDLKGMHELWVKLQWSLMTALKELFPEDKPEGEAVAAVAQAPESNGNTGTL